MNIFRLKATICGTSRSKRLKKDEIVRTCIPTWTPNPMQNLYSTEDYMHNMILNAPLRTGDWIKKLSLETTEVPSGIDLESSENLELYGADENDSVKWELEVDLVQQFIKNIVEDESLFSSALDELAAQIVSEKDIFGWSNVDPSDLIPEIVSELVALGYGDDEVQDDMASYD